MDVLQSKLSDLEVVSQDDSHFKDQVFELLLEAYVSKVEDFEVLAKKVKEAEHKFKIDNIKAQQVDVLGSKRLYERIHKNFLELKFERFFVEEQFKLYDWREDFFHKHFPFPPDKERNNWYTDGGDDTHAFDTLALNVTQYFDKVVQLACTVTVKNREDKVWFDADEEISNKVHSLYSAHYVEHGVGIEFCYKEDLKKLGLTFNDAAHSIVAIYQISPLKLEHLAIKKVLEYDISLHDVPKEIQIKAAVGMFNGEDEDIPDYISQQGKEIFQFLRKEFGYVECSEIDEVEVEEICRTEIVCKQNVLEELISSGRRIEGYISKWITGYGFLVLDGFPNTPDVFLHISDIVRKPPGPSWHFLHPGRRMEVSIEKDLIRNKVKAVAAKVL